MQTDWRPGDLQNHLKFEQILLNAELPVDSAFLLYLNTLQKKEFSFLSQSTLKVSQGFGHTQPQDSPQQMRAVCRI